MFSQASVILFRGNGVGTSHGRVPPFPSPKRHQTWTPIPLSPFPRHQTWLSTSGGKPWKHVQTCSLEDLPPPPTISTVVTSRSDHRNTYGWQAGGTHPTWMLSCVNDFFRKLIVKGTLGIVCCRLSCKTLHVLNNKCKLFRPNNFVALHQV